MSNKILIQKIILIILVVFIGALTAFKFFANANPINVQAYTYSKPSYYGQYNYRYNSGYMPYNAYRGSGAANYVGGYGNHGWSPFLMPSTCSTWYGCGNNYNSHIYIDSKEMYQYYKNPWLLEPRRMDNHQWYARGLWPQGFNY